jgi:putative oxidoreductase
MKLPFLLGRAIFGGFFLYSGIHHLTDSESLTEYAKFKGVPMPELAVKGSGLALILGGTSILLGVKPKIGTAAVLGFLASVSPVMHDFWNVDDPQNKQSEMVNFTKNLALLGGTLALMGVEEPWPMSVPVGQPSRIERARRFMKSPRAA